ncbi:hypothetical protein CWD92_29340 [Burkholderia thailandensis]|nr:hypothetical protein CWD92_29340 [Burkholderia thailandensis]
MPVDTCARCAGGIGAVPHDTANLTACVRAPISILVPARSRDASPHARSARRSIVHTQRNKSHR